jgi:hypothetical protein
VTELRAQATHTAEVEKRGNPADLSAIGGLVSADVTPIDLFANAPGGRSSSDDAPDIHHRSLNRRRDGTSAVAASGLPARCNLSAARATAMKGMSR